MSQIFQNYKNIRGSPFEFWNMELHVLLSGIASNEALVDAEKCIYSGESFGKEFNPRESGLFQAILKSVSVNEITKLQKTLCGKKCIIWSRDSSKIWS